MPYKIYTYADPYRIAETDFWPDIQDVPHLCSSRTLVNGMVDVMQDSIRCLICPLDETLTTNLCIATGQKIYQVRFSSMGT